MTTTATGIQKGNEADVVNQELALDLYIKMLLDEPSDESVKLEIELKSEPKLIIEPEPEPEPEPVAKIQPELDLTAYAALAEPESTAETVMEKAAKLSPVAFAEPESIPSLNLQTKIKLQPEPELELEVEVEVKQEKTLVVVDEPEPEPVEELQEQTSQFLSIMPDWSQDEFQALFFRVDKMVLATPLIELSRTIKYDRETTKIPRQPQWFMGLLEEQGKKVGVLDTGQLIFGKTLGSQRDLVEHPFKCLLITQDGNWGLACDEVLSIGRLEPHKVRWRTHRKNRTWLIGTVIEELTAIIDVNELIPRKKG